MTMGVFLLIVGYLGVYSAVKGANPIDVLVSTFTGKPLDASLRGNDVTPGMDYDDGDNNPNTVGCGILENFHPNNDPDGNHQTHGHLAMESEAALIIVGNMLIAIGARVGEHRAFGGVQGKHDSNSWHYENKAIDYNFDGNERALLIDAATKKIPRWACIATGNTKGGKGKGKDESPQQTDD